ncbi:MAG TPA: stalk domain-containing protein [Paenibacillus sp.]|nr:stalk domain-containing protein [Paenibacillus sp.]
MKKINVIAIVTAAGLVATSASVGAQTLYEKVSGFLNHDVAIIVNGEKTGYVPVFIDGKAYLPVRDVAEGIGYEVNYDDANNEIELNDRTKEEDDAEAYMRGTGVVASVTPLDGGKLRIEFLGLGSNAWVLLTVDEKTKLQDRGGNAVSAEDLTVGTHVDVEYGPAMAMSYPGQSHAASVTVVAKREVKEDVIQSVVRTDDGWQVRFGETRDGTATATLVLNAGKETSVMTSQGEPVAWEDLKAGMKVRAYYGPMMTKSLPPQSPLFFLTVLSETSAPIGKLSPETAKQFRDLAWAELSEEQKEHLTTKPDEAKVEIASAVGSGVLASTEGQQKLLAELQASQGNLVTVTYETDQDELLGPLTVAFDFETKAFVGFYARR